MTIRVRPINDKDIDSILVLLHQLWPDKTIDRQHVRRLIQQQLTSENHYLVVAEQQGTIVGFGSLSMNLNLWVEGIMGRIDEIVIDQHERQQGYGTLLLHQLVAVGTQLGCKRIEVNSAHHRKHAHAFYQSNEFENRAILFSKQVSS